jgi:hypothetical protein
MLDKLFGNSEHEKQEQANHQALHQAMIEKEKRDQEFRDRNLSFFEKVEKYIDEDLLEKENPQRSEELFTINQGGIDFESRGFDFNGIVLSDVDAPKTIKVNYKGLIYSLNLAAGYNQTNILDGSRLSCDEGIVVGLVRTSLSLK